MADASDIRAALRQQLAGDAMMGVRSVPMPPLAPRPAPPAAPTRPPAPSSADRIVPTPRAAATRTSAPTPLTGDSDKVDRLHLLDERQVKPCRKCRLCETRTKTVFGQGTVDARLVFVGEGPGYDEDQQGLAFVGKAGQLLTRMINAMGLTRDEVFICNTVKCRPPENRDPAADEIVACNPYLVEQLATIRPEVIVALGAPAAKTLLATTTGIGQLRARWHDYYLSGTRGVGPSIPLMPTYHPAYLLRYESEKGKTWSDLQMVMERLGLPLPKK